MEIIMLPEIYQVILTNFNGEIYTGTSKEEAMDKAVWAGFETTVLLDGSLFATYSPISGWKKYATA